MARKSQAACEVPDKCQVKAFCENSGMNPNLERILKETTLIKYFDGCQKISGQSVDCYRNDLARAAEIYPNVHPCLPLIQITTKQKVDDVKKNESWRF